MTRQRRNGSHARRVWSLGGLLLILGVLCGCVALLCPPAHPALAQGSLSIGPLPGRWADADYRARYALPASVLAGVSTNAGGDLSLAFDGNWSTEWVAQQDNMGQGNDPNGLITQIEVAFTRPVTLAALAYRCGSRQVGYGYFTHFTLYAITDGQEREIGDAVSTATGDTVYCEFGAPYTCEGVRVVVHEVCRLHKWVAAAAELQLLQPASEQLDAVYDHLFTDYTRTALAQPYASPEAIDALEQSLQGVVGYADTIAPLLQRALQVLAHTVRYDARREFGTELGNLPRQGDLRTYASGTLKMSTLGTNRLVTGITANANDTITVTVTAPDGVPLPRICFSQAYGYWNSWLDTYELTRGVNTFTVPDKVTDSYTTPVPAGGPIYLMNPYTPDQQPGDVRVYIEGGSFFPVYYKGQDPAGYFRALSDYNEALQGGDATIDVTELVGEHVIMTLRASEGNRVYRQRGADPDANLQDWDACLESLFRFDGIPTDPAAPGYSPMNALLRTNIRVVQYYAGAYMYSAGEHIGIYAQDAPDGLGTEDLFFDCSGGIGWGIVHEIGHAMDIGWRTTSECSNNMISNSWQVASGQGVHNPDFYTAVHAALMFDDTLPESLWLQNVQNYLIYWLIEDAFPGYWGRQDNLYRTRSDLEDWDFYERQVYLSSLAVGLDLGYYFERWGYGWQTLDADGNVLDRKIFRVAEASEQYRQAMDQAFSRGDVTREQKKFWYLDSLQSTIVRTAEQLSLYDAAHPTQIERVLATDGGYTLILPQPPSIAHLGYEIYVLDGADNEQFLGFTYEDGYLDAHTYSFIPRYRAVAFDRSLNASAKSEAVGPGTLRGERVCRVGDQFYDTLQEGIAGALAAGQPLLLCKDATLTALAPWQGRLVVQPDPALQTAPVLTLLGGGAMFTVGTGAELELSGTAEVPVVLDGGGRERSGALIALQAGGTLTLTHVNLIHNYNRAEGGAILATGGQMTLDAVRIQGNRAARGGAIAVTAAGCRWTMTGSTLSDNRAEGEGGAVYNVGSATLSQCTLTGNAAAMGGGVANCRGGVLQASGSSFSENTASGEGGGAYLDGNTLFSECLFAQNSGLSGAIFQQVQTNVQARTVSLSACEVRAPGGTPAVKVAAGILRLSGGRFGGDVVLGAGGSALLYGAMPVWRDGEDHPGRLLPAQWQEGQALLQLAGDVTLSDADVAALPLADGWHAERTPDALLLAADPAAGSVWWGFRAQEPLLEQLLPLLAGVQAHPLPTGTVWGSLDMGTDGSVTLPRTVLGLFAVRAWWIGQREVAPGGSVTGLNAGDRISCDIAPAPVALLAYRVDGAVEAQPGEGVCLPAFTPESHTPIFAWQDQAGEIWYPYSRVSLTRPTVFTALYAGPLVHFLPPRPDVWEQVRAERDRVVALDADYAPYLDFALDALDGGTWVLAAPGSNLDLAATLGEGYDFTLDGQPLTGLIVRTDAELHYAPAPPAPEQPGTNPGTDPGTDPGTGSGSDPGSGSGSAGGGGSAVAPDPGADPGDREGESGSVQPGRDYTVLWIVLGVVGGVALLAVVVTLICIQKKLKKHKK